MTKTKTENLEQFDINQVVACDSKAHHIDDNHSGKAEWYVSVHCNCGEQIRAWCDKFTQYYLSLGSTYIFCARCGQEFISIKVLEKIKM